MISSENGAVSSRYPAPFSAYQRLRKLSYKEQQELSDLEARIDSLEIRKKALQEEINRSSSDYQRLQDLADQLQAVEVELEASMERWLESSEFAKT